MFLNTLSVLPSRSWLARRTAQSSPSCIRCLRTKNTFYFKTLLAFPINPHTRLWALSLPLRYFNAGNWSVLKKNAKYHYLQYFFPFFRWTPVSHLADCPPLAEAPATCYPLGGHRSAGFGVVALAGEEAVLNMYENSGLSIPRPN